MRYLLVLVVIGLVAHAALGQMVCEKRYAPVGASFSFCPPADWVSREAEPFDVFSKKDDSGPDRFTLTISDTLMPRDYGLENVAFSLIRRSYQNRSDSNVLLREVGETRVDDELVAHRLVFDMDSAAGKHVKVIYYVVPAFGKAYIFRFRFPSADGTQVRRTPLLEKMS